MMSADLKNFLGSPNKHQCLVDLRSTDPRDDKTRIEQSKGYLLRGSYQWVLENAEFQQWRRNENTQLLWIKGDPGKGKTMLLCGIIDELTALERLIDQQPGALVSYFFCEAADARSNDVTSVLRGLIYLLADKQPSLIGRIQKKHDHAGKALFEDANAWFAVSGILTEILQDPQLKATYLIIDALDECAQGDLPKLLDFVLASSSSRVKWIISSRNRPDIEQRIRSNQHLVTLSLEQNAEHVSRSVDEYIKLRVANLSSIADDEDRQAQVRNIMRRKAHGTFLWVSLVIRELDAAKSWEVQHIVEELPESLKEVYRRMIRQIKEHKRRLPEQCWLLLSTAAVAYQPLRLDELALLAGIQDNISDKPQFIAEIVNLCGSFLTILSGVVYIIHQSAKEFLIEDASRDIFPLGINHTHHAIFSKSLQAMSHVLRRDIYGLVNPVFPIDKVQEGSQGPLDGIYYSDSEIGAAAFRHNCRVWSIVFSPDGEQLVLATYDAAARSGRRDAVQIYDVRRLNARGFQKHKNIEGDFGRVWSAAFSPDCKMLAAGCGDGTVRLWDATTGMLIRSLKGNTNQVNSVVFSSNGKRLASASYDGTLRLWDIYTAAPGPALRRSRVTLIAFSPDHQQLVSASCNRMLLLWETSTGTVQHELKGQKGRVSSVAFSSDSKVLAAGFSDGTVWLWDTQTAEQLLILDSKAKCSNSIAIRDDTQLVPQPGSGTRWLRNINWWARPSGAITTVSQTWGGLSGLLLKAMKGNTCHVDSVAFSPDGQELASAIYDGTLLLWDISAGTVRTTLKGHTGKVNSVAFSPNGQTLASSSDDSVVLVWDVAIGALLWTLEGNTDRLLSVAFSPDNRRLLSSSHNGTLWQWNVATGVLLNTYAMESTSRLSFINESTIITDRAITSLDELSHCSEASESFEHHNDSKAVGWALSDDRCWINWNGRSVLWLPPEYRPVRSAVATQKLAIGCSSGNVLILGFASDGQMQSSAKYYVLDS
ncbi:wd40 repeat [Trichoderma arundinaceum]|uniref:Wd40 repeat n=1 Tax=Trichoderma arundinaceum TaxID=490622 RepID=A0A395NW09_TRIAR|nr:wd40 repeat [Trichoderma arundinaceum]